MIVYQPGQWSLCFVLKLHGSVLPKACVWAFTCSLATLFWQQFVIEYTEYDFHAEFRVTGLVTSLVGSFTFILGFLVVFRSQQAYSRWWEGGTLLQQLRGEWFNAFSSLLAFCNDDPAAQGHVRLFQHRLARLMSLLYSSALQQVTTMEDARFELIELEGFDVESIAFLDHTHDRCEVVLQWIQRLIVEASNAETVKVAPPILSRVYNQLGNGIVNLNNARKISDFPIPFPLAQMLTLMLMCNWCIVSLFCAVAFASMISAALISFMVMMGFWSVNYIAVELEEPFGSDPNDLPLQDMQKDLNRSLIGLLHPLALMHPPYELTESAESLNVVELDLDVYMSERDEVRTRQQATKKPRRLKTGKTRELGLNRQSTVDQRSISPFSENGEHESCIDSETYSKPARFAGDDEDPSFRRGATFAEQVSISFVEVDSGHFKDENFQYGAKAGGDDIDQLSNVPAAQDHQQHRVVARPAASEVNAIFESTDGHMDLLRLCSQTDRHLQLMLTELKVISSTLRIDRLDSKSTDRLIPVLSSLPSSAADPETLRIERELKSPSTVCSAGCAACRL